MRMCTQCLETKEDEAFALRSRTSGRRHAVCRTCKTAYNKVWYQNNRETHLVVVAAGRGAILKRNREWLVLLKRGLKCGECGECHPACLDFHHEDPTEKDLEVASAISKGWSIKRLEAEVAKCIVLCSNCHRKHHYEARSTTG